VKEEVRQHPKQYCQEEPEDLPTAASLGSDWLVGGKIANRIGIGIQHWRLSHSRPTVGSVAGWKRPGNHMPATLRQCLCDQRLLELGKILVNEIEDFFSEVFDLLLGRSFHQSCALLLRMNLKPASRFAIDVNFKSGLVILQRKLQTWKRFCHGGRQAFLNFLLQLFTCRGFKWRNGRIAGTGDESALGLGLNSIGEPLNQVFNFHPAAILADLTGDTLITSVLCRAHVLAGVGEFHHRAVIAEWGASAEVRDRSENAFQIAALGGEFQSRILEKVPARILSFGDTVGHED
jgi:hypothetical protein